MKYSIGEFAEITGVTVDTLRLYEKHDIIKPMRDEQNNYRYYDDLDVRNLLMSRWYRSIQIPLQDVATITREPSKDIILEKLREVKNNLEEEIKSKTMLLNKIIEINRDLNEIESSLNNCKKKEVPGIYRLKQTRKNTLLQDDMIISVVDEWMDLLPFTFYSFRIDNEGILSNEEYLEYNWGLGIWEEEANYFNLKLNDHIEYFPPRTCISSVILSSHSKHLMRSSFQFMIDYIEENNLKINGNIFGKIILTEKVDGEKRSYLEVNIPILQKTR